MLYRPFGKLGWNVSAVGLGTWNIGNQWGDMTDEQAIEIIRAAYDSGINLFDTADAYGIPHGMSEFRLGKALKGIRDKVYIISKIANWGMRTGGKLGFQSLDDVRVCGHAICGRLGTDHIDSVLCHNAMIQDPAVFIEGFRALVQEGFVRSYGISTNNFDVFKRFYDASNGECAVVELDYSLINKAPEQDLLPFCQQHGIAVLVRGPVAQGILAGKYDEKTVFTDTVRKTWNEGQSSREKYLADLGKMRAAQEGLAAIDPAMPLAQAAVRYTISHPANPVSIPGATSVKQVKDNALAGERVFTTQEFAQL